MINKILPLISTTLRYPKLFLSVTILCMALGTAEAQQTPGSSDTAAPMVLPPVTIEGAPIAPSSLTQPPPDAVAKVLQSVPGGTNLIDAEQYKVGRASNLQDVLQRQPGIYIGSRGGTDEVKLSIRGSGLDRNFHLRSIKLLQDGIPISQGDGDGDFQWIEPLAQQDVEVYRGANALQYGSSTLGGAINFSSPTGYTAPGLQARIENGSYDYVKGQVSSGLVLGKLDYYASASSFYRNGFQNHSRTSAERFSANIGYRFNPNLETRFYGGYVNTKLQLPGDLTKGGVSQHPRSAAPNSITFDQRRDGTYIYGGNKTTLRIGENQQIDAGLYWTYRDLYHPLFWNPFFLNGLGVLDLHSNTYGGNLRYVDNRELFGQKNNLTLGFSPQMSFSRDRRFQNLSGHKGSMTANGEQFLSNFEFYGENQHYFSKNLALVLGNQASYAVRNYQDQFHGNPNGNQTRRLDYFGYNPKAGLLYNLSPTSQLYTNFSRSFEPPTESEILQTVGIAGNVITRKLKAQRGSTFEIGARGATSRASWDTTYYYSLIRNELLSLNDALGNPRGTINGDSTRHQGVESGVSLVLAKGLFTKSSPKDVRLPIASVGPGFTPLQNAGSDRLVLRQVYDWNRFRFAHDPIYSHNQLPGIPEHFYRAELIYEHPSGFYIQPNIEWAISRFPVDYANTLNANPHLTLGVRTGYRSKRGWSAYVDFRNLTNQHYASATQVLADARTSGSAPMVFSPAEGFSVYGGVELRW